MPFLILILAGVMSLVSLVTDRMTGASASRSDLLTIQNVEQERMAEFYFRVLSWLSGLKPQAAAPSNTSPKSPAERKVVKSPQRGDRRGKIEFCSYSSSLRAISKSGRHDLD